MSKKVSLAIIIYLFNCRWRINPLAFDRACFVFRIYNTQCECNITVKLQESAYIGIIFVYIDVFICEFLRLVQRSSFPWKFIFSVAKSINHTFKIHIRFLFLVSFTEAISFYYYDAVTQIKSAKNNYDIFLLRIWESL